MLMIEALRGVRRGLSRLPVLARIGLLVIVVAGPLDVAVHLASGPHAGHSGVEHLAHLVGIVGMVLVMAGVVMHGTSRQLNRRRRGEHWRSS